LPKVGLLSDSHSAEKMTAKAVELLIGQGAELLVHLGDVCSMSVLDALVCARPGDTKPVEAHLVFGNVDWDWEALARYASELGLIVDHPVGNLTFGDQSMIFMHGHDHAAMNRAVSAQPTYICHGHSHEMRDDRMGPTRFINPGALFRATSYTVALLDTDTDDLRFMDVPKP
jgi:putative phosphoesterase